MAALVGCIGIGIILNAVIIAVGLSLQMLLYTCVDSVLAYSKLRDALLECSAYQGSGMAEKLRRFLYY
jgi:hypothetical protein